MGCDLTPKISVMGRFTKRTIIHTILSNNFQTVENAVSAHVYRFQTLETL